MRLRDPFNLQGRKRACGSGCDHLSHFRFTELDVSKLVMVGSPFAAPRNVSWGPEAEEGAAQEGEGLVDIGAPFAADRDATEAVELGQRALDDPAVPPHPFADLHASSCDTGLDGAGAALGSASAVIIGLVDVVLVGTLFGGTCGRAGRRAWRRGSVPA